jgi:hypothetical protein
MQIFAWFRTTENAYETRHVAALGETVEEARRNILDRAEKLFQYDCVSPSERDRILSGDKEAFQWVADKRQEWMAQLLADISSEPTASFDDGTVFLS